MKQGNQIFTLLKLHHNKNWDWTSISSGKFMSMAFLLEFPNAPWNWTAVTINLNISNEDILAHLDMPWDWGVLSVGQSVGQIYGRDTTLEFIQKVGELMHNPPWDWSALSSNRRITWEFVQAHINEAWNWQALSHTLGWDIVLANPGMPWNCYQMSSSPRITWEFVQAHFSYPWNWNALSANARIGIDDIIAHKDCPWNWDIVMRKNGFTWRTVAATMDKPWNWADLSFKLVFDSDDAIAFAVECQDLWHYGNLSCGRDNSFGIVDALPHKPWIWKELSRNKNITFDVIMRYGDKPWKWSAVTPTLHRNIMYTMSQRKLAYKFYNKTRLSIQRRKRAFSHCMLAIRMKPELGVDYFAIKDEVEALSN